jgi:hypothetical protein
MILEVRGGELGGSYLSAMGAAFAFAHELGRQCSPVHLLVGVAAGDGAAAAALRTSGQASLRDIVERDQDVFAEGAAYLQVQAQGAARMFGEDRGEPVAAEHLLVALLDQATPEVLEALHRAGIDRASARQASLLAIGAPLDVPPLRLPAATPAGTFDRPALAVSDLDARAWAVLCWRQEHLPMKLLRRRSDWWALSRLESAAAIRVGSQLTDGDDQLYSLRHHHAHEVERRAVLARPDLVPARSSRTVQTSVPITRLSRRRPRRPRFLNFTYGWGVWFKNRQGGLQYHWFCARAASYYRGAPQP